MNRKDSIALGLGCGVAAAAVIYAATGPSMAQAPAPKAPVKTAAVKPTAAPLSGPGSLNGVWANALFKNYRTGPPLDASRAGERAASERANPKPPYQPWAQAIADKTMKEAAAAAAAGKPRGGSGCMTSGFPGAMSPPIEDVIQIVETPDQKQITVLTEFHGTFRIIHMNEKHPDDPDPTYMGNAVGHWEGGTLVVDTIAMSDKVDNTNGVPHGDDLHFIEHIRRVDKNTLEDRVTTIDPKVYTKPWDRVITLKQFPGLQVREWVCDNQRNGPDENGATSVQLQGAKS